MLGSKEPVIPPASEEREKAPPPAAAAPNGNSSATPSPDASLATLVERMRAEVKRSNPNLAAVLNGSCHVDSWQDGILTLVIYADFHKKKVEGADARREFEAAAATMLGSPVSIRCIMGARPARQIGSKLVQHAVESHGAKIVSEE